MIKTRKIKLIVKGTPQEKKEGKKIIVDMVKSCAKLSNELIRSTLPSQFELYEMTHGENKMSVKDAQEKILEGFNANSMKNIPYDYSKRWGQIPSEIRGPLSNNIYSTMKNNLYDMIKGDMSIPSYTNTAPIPINFTSKVSKQGPTGVFKIDEDGYYYFKFPKSQKSEGEGVYLNLFFGKDRSNNKVIMERILSSEYKLCDSSIQLKDNNLFLLLTYNQPNKDIKDPNKIMGIDVGINRPVSIHILDQKNQPYQINLGDKIHYERTRLRKMRQSLQGGLKFAKGGHGRKKKTVRLESLKDKEKNWARTMNHTISKSVIDLAIKNEVGVIKMEDLSGITKDTNNVFLKSWAYFQLQTDIEYKAKVEGITIEWVQPQYTSVTCPTCGNIDKENRSSEDVTKFTCINSICEDYDKKKDADVVAAENISKSVGYSVKPKSKKGRMMKITTVKTNVLSNTEK